MGNIEKVIRESQFGLSTKRLDKTNVHSKLSAGRCQQVASVLPALFWGDHIIYLF